MAKKGSLVCVGTGMMLGAHITPRARSYIENADIVFVSVSDGIVEKWVEGMNANVKSLQSFYSEGKSRNTTYKEMQNAILTEVRAGKKVVGAFYGHPGVFALAPHKSIQQARDEGFEAHMEPGISAEDCLFADLGIDPGSVGCQQYEASQFLFYKRVIDPSAFLILWQVGIVGDTSFAKFSTGVECKKILTDELLKTYPKSHSVILYEAATLPVTKIRKQEVNIEALHEYQLNPETTLIIPPSKQMIENKAIKEYLIELGK